MPKDTTRTDDQVVTDISETLNAHLLQSYFVVHWWMVLVDFALGRMKHILLFNVHEILFNHQALF